MIFELLKLMIDNLFGIDIFSWCVVMIMLAVILLLVVKMVLGCFFCCNNLFLVFRLEVNLKDLGSMSFGWNGRFVVLRVF